METEKKLGEILGWKVELPGVAKTIQDGIIVRPDYALLALWRECLRLMAEQEWVKGIVRDLIGAENPQELARGLNELAPDAGLGKPARKYPLTTTDVAIVRAADFLAGRPITLPEQEEK